MLETWNLVQKYTYKCVVSQKYAFLVQNLLNVADASIFFYKKSAFLAKLVSLLKAIVWKIF